MTDITELTQSLKRRATSAKEFGESLYVKADDVLALVEALEKAQRANAAQGDHIEQQQYRIEQLERGNQYAAKRIAELESRTVKLPEPFELAWLSGGSSYYYADEVDAALTAQGIKVEAE